MGVLDREAPLPTIETAPPLGAAAKPDLREASVAQLVTQTTELTSRLVRDEIRLAQLELAAKGKRAATGAGLFGGAGVSFFYGAGVGIAAAVIAIALVLPAWGAALIVMGALFLLGGILAMIGRRQFKRAGTAAPQQVMAGVKEDLKVISSGARRR